MKVIGLTGTIAAGKELVREELQKRFNCYYVSLSSIIRGELEKKKKSFNRATLQDLGNHMRKSYGHHILAKLAVSYMPRDKEMMIVDGIRNPGEIDFLKKTFGGDFKLIAVDADTQIRFQRVLSRARSTDPKTYEDFLKIDQRDQGSGEKPFGQNSKSCMEKADFTLMNDGNVQDFVLKMNEMLQKI